MSQQLDELIVRVIEIRKSEGLSQTELAEIVGCSQQAISRFERKRLDPTLKTWIKILSALGYGFELTPKLEKITKEIESE